MRATDARDHCELVAVELGADGRASERSLRVRRTGPHWAAVIKSTLRLGEPAQRRGLRRERREFKSRLRDSIKLQLPVERPHTCVCCNELILSE